MDLKCATEGKCFPLPFVGETDKAWGEWHLSVNDALTSQPDFPASGKVREWGEGTVYFSGRAAGSLPRGHVLTFFFVSSFTYMLACACMCSQTHHFNHCFMSIKSKGKRMCNGVNSLSVYFNIVQSYSLQLLLYKVVLSTNRKPGFFCLCCISKATFWLSFTCSRVCILCLLYYKQICSLQIPVFINHS